MYEDRNDPRMVIKVLHQQHATPQRSAKLQAMCNNPPQNAQALSWPDVVETDAGGAPLPDAQSFREGWHGLPVHQRQ